MQGYHRRPVSEDFDSDGFLRTSDLGELDGDGRLVWRGRIDDMIRTNGINVSPVEVETILESIDTVRRAAVTSLPDNYRGERVVALVLLDRQSQLDELKILALLKARLAKYKLPSEIQIVNPDQIPITGSGKVDRRRLKETILEVFYDGS
jgi:fatty-acyl-CoA synthase